METVGPANAPWALISISHLDDHPIVNENDLMLGRLNQQYHDIDRINPKYRKERTIFTPVMADHVLDFYLDMLDRNVEIMFIHCQAGLCRSPATAAALQKIETNDDMIWFSTKRPNLLVYRTILDRAHNRGIL
jgi:predicted protein tyrosine phosphatase